MLPTSEELNHGGPTHAIGPQKACEAFSWRHSSLNDANL
jgi:hypothetical protein